jgi:hypothetical protein
LWFDVVTTAYNNKKTRSFVRNGVFVSQSYFPPARDGTFNCIAISRARLSPFSSESQYKNAIYQPTEYRKHCSKKTRLIFKIVKPAETLDTKGEDNEITETENYDLKPIQL